MALPRRQAEGSDAGGLHAAELVFELADLVAEAGGDLELELGGGRVHLLGELLDQFDQVLAGGAAALAEEGLADTGAGGPGARRGAGRQARSRRLAAALLAPGAADELVGVGVLADQLVEDVGDPL